MFIQGLICAVIQNSFTHAASSTPCTFDTNCDKFLKNSKRKKAKKLSESGYIIVSAWIRKIMYFAALLFGNQLASHPRHIGCIDPHCNVRHVVEGKACTFVIF